jgi:hypothetical protein
MAGRMTKLELSLIGGLMVASGLASWTIQSSARSMLRDRNERQQRQTEQLAHLSLEKTRLSNLVTPARSPQSLSNEEFRELLRLRSQVGQLRRAKTELESLRATNQQLRVALGEARKGLPSTGEERTNEVRWSREQLTFAGYADPESAMKSTLWAWVNSDPSSFLANCSAEERANFEGAWAGRSEAEIAALFKGMANFYSFAAEGARVLSNKTLSPEEAVLDLHFDRDGKNRRFVLRKSGDKWKVDGLVAIFN